MLKNGKMLEDLAYDVDVLHCSLRTILDDQACICWDEEDGTLVYANSFDGMPEAYYAPHHEFASNRDDFTSLARFVCFLKTVCDSDDFHRLLTAPVWYAVEDRSIDSEGNIITYTTDQIAAFNSLLCDIQIDL